MSRNQSVRLASLMAAFCAIAGLTACGGGGGDNATSRSGPGDEVVITPPSGAPDMTVGTPAVSDSSPDAGASFTLRATVRNGGDGGSAATTLRYYRSSDATISASDTAVGTDAVSALSASGTSAQSISLPAPSSAGTYYYGACVDTVSGESDTRNNCSGGVRVNVSRSGGTGGTGGAAATSGTAGPTSTRASYCNSGNSRHGAIVHSWRGQFCEDGYSWCYAYNFPDLNSAISGAESACQSAGLAYRGLFWVFTRCGALAYGKSGPRCGLRRGKGATRSAAEQDALSKCRADFTECEIAGYTPSEATPQTDESENIDFLSQDRMNQGF